MSAPRTEYVATSLTETQTAVAPSSNKRYSETEFAAQPLSEDALRAAGYVCGVNELIASLRQACDWHATLGISPRPAGCTRGGTERTTFGYRIEHTWRSRATCRPCSSSPNRLYERVRSSGRAVDYSEVVSP